MAQKIRNFNDLESILESTKSFGDKEQDNHAILSGTNSKDPASSRADLWSYFIDTVEAYSGNKEERKPYFIDRDIVQTFNELDIDGLSNVNVINCILRTFILYNKDELKNYLKKRKTTLLD